MTTDDQRPRIQRVETPAPYRDHMELRFFAELRPCPFCGNREIDNLTSGPLLTTETIRQRRLYGPCSRCGADREFVGIEGGSDPLLLPGQPYPRDLVRSPEPSKIIGPHEFLAEYDRRAAFYSAEPEARTPEELDAEKDGLFHLGTAEQCVFELAKFLRPGEDAIADDAYAGDGWPAARHDRPERYTRAWIESAKERMVDLEARYRAHLDRVDRSKVPRRPLEWPGGPFGRLALADHERWTKRGGAGEGTRRDNSDRSFVRVDASTRILSGLILTRVGLDGANLSFAELRASVWTDARLTRADLTSANLAGATLTGCDFTRAVLGTTKLGDSTIKDCTFDAAHLDRSTWYRAKVVRGSFRGAFLGHAAFDHARFIDCDFRDADFSVAIPELLNTAFDAVFVRCDFRNTRWTARDLYRAHFVDCKFGGVSGPPAHASGMTCDRPDLSEDGTGTPGADRFTLCAVWGMDMDYLRDQDAKYAVPNQYQWTYVPDADDAGTPR